MCINLSWQQKHHIGIFFKLSKTCLKSPARDFRSTLDLRLSDCQTCDVTYQTVLIHSAGSLGGRSEDVSAHMYWGKCSFSIKVEGLLCLSVCLYVFTKTEYTFVTKHHLHFRNKMWYNTHLWINALDDRATGRLACHGENELSLIGWLKPTISLQKWLNLNYISFTVTAL